MSLKDDVASARINALLDQVEVWQRYSKALETDLVDIAHATGLPDGSSADAITEEIADLRNQARAAADRLGL